jgi:transposase
MEVHMADTRRPKPSLVLLYERQTLRRFTNRRKAAHPSVCRAHTALACAAGATNREVAEGLRIDRNTVGKWRIQFAAEGLDGLLDEARPEAPRVTSDDQVETVLTMTVRRTPGNPGMC